MFEDLTRLFRHSAVYTVGNILKRGGAIVLLPLYTHYLSPEEFGVLTIFYVTAYVVRSLLSMGVAHSTLRFYFEFESEDDRRRVISTCLLAAIMFGIVGIGLLLPFAGLASQALFHSTVYVRLFQIVLGTLLLEMTIEVMQAYIRARERSVLFVMMSLVQLLSKVAFNVYTVVMLKKGVEGILWGNLASVALVWIVLLPITVRYSGLHFDLGKLKVVLRYGLPLVPGLILGMIAVSSDRLMLTHFSTLSIIGMYGLALNAGVLVHLALIEPFTLGFGPYRFAIMRQANAKAIYGRVLTYFVAAVVMACLAVSVFAKEVITVIASPEYLEAHRLVPLICMGVLFSGATYVLQTGVYVAKETKYILYMNVVRCASVLLLQVWLIPGLNMMGAAVAGTVSMLLGAVAAHVFSQKVYPIPYEWRRIFTVLGCGVALYLASRLVPDGHLGVSMLVKTALVMAFPFVLGLVGFYRKDELERLWSWLEVSRLRTQLVSQGSKRAG